MLLKSEVFIDWLTDPCKNCGWLEETRTRKRRCSPDIDGGKDGEFSTNGGVKKGEGGKWQGENKNEEISHPYGHPGLEIFPANEG